MLNLYVYYLYLNCENSFSIQRFLLIMLTSVSSQKVTPINDDVEVPEGHIQESNLVLGLGDISQMEPRMSHEGMEPRVSQEEVDTRFYLKQMAINRQIEWIESLFTYDYIKSTTLWFLDTATCKISITVRYYCCM